jgi:hypothetical protein
VGGVSAGEGVPPEKFGARGAESFGTFVAWGGDQFDGRMRGDVLFEGEG